jgi:hypothetical protein
MWLLESGGFDAALAGDLIEERARGRSITWYWRQLLMAAWIGNCNAIRHHKVLAVRAVATGCAVEWVLVFIWNHWVPDLPVFSMLQWTVQIAAALLTQVLVGWVIARTHRAQPLPMVLLFLFCFLTWYLYGVSSWITVLVRYSVPEPRFLAFIAMFSVTALMAALGMLLGVVLALVHKAQSAKADPPTR